MHIDALRRIYTIQFAHNLAAVHGERYSVVVLYKERKVQSCIGRFIEKASAKAKEDTRCVESARVN